MDSITVPNFVIKYGLNVDVPNQYMNRYGDFEKYESTFFEIVDNDYCVKSEYVDLVRRVPAGTVSIIFVVSNDASVASRRYQESYICQTPLCYSYTDLLNLFLEKIPKVRQRNATTTFFEPIIPEVCAKHLILVALIQSTMVNRSKNIVLSITSKSLKITYSLNPGLNNKEVLKTRREYFETFGIDVAAIEKEFETYSKQHRIKTRVSFFNGIQTIEVLFNVRKTTFKKYAVADDKFGLLSKAEYDIYGFVKDRGGSSANLIAEEFGYNSNRSVKYHVDKLKKLGLVEMVGKKKSHDCFYRVIGSAKTSKKKS